MSITEKQSITGRLGVGVSVPNVDLSEYALKNELPTKPEDIGAQPAGNYLTKVPEGYATEQFVEDKIADAQLSGDNVDYVVQDTAPEDTSVLWVDPTDNSDDGFQEAVNTALALAKARGEFNGADGQPGKDGQDYILTPDDKTEIAEMAAELVDIPTDDHINELIDMKLSEIPNAAEVAY